MEVIGYLAGAIVTPIYLRALVGVVHRYSPKQQKGWTGQGVLTVVFSNAEILTIAEILIGPS